MIQGALKQGLSLCALLFLAACAGGVPLASVPAPERAAIHQRLMHDITVLASDEFQGRKPGTIGEERTIAFITAEMQKAGLVSGTNDPGSAWRAPVDLVSTSPFTSRIVIRPGRRAIELDERSAVAFTVRRRELLENAQLVFVGEQVADVAASAIAGSIAVMMGAPDGNSARRAILFDKGAAAIITVVADDAAIAQVNRAYGKERLQLKSETEGPLTAFVSATAMAQALGSDWDKLVEASDDEGGAPVRLPVRLNATATIEANSRRREFTSYNVLGLLPGQVRGSGAIVLMGHWDHLGECGAQDAADRICNGAVDNASGIAVMLELARRLKARGPHDRDIYWVATSAEEYGLLGAKAFVEAPPVPLDTIIAAFNFDTVALAPSGSPVGLVGEGRTSLDPVIAEIMGKARRELGDRDLAESFVRRQDGWALLQEGVPALLLSTSFGSEIVLGPYLATDYHRAGDEVEAVVLDGAIEDLLLHEALVIRIADIEGYSPPAIE